MLAQADELNLARLLGQIKVHLTGTLTGNHGMDEFGEIWQASDAHPRV